MYDPIKEEQKILEFWEKNKIFDKLKAKNSGKLNETLNGVDSLALWSFLSAIIATFVFPGFGGIVSIILGSIALKKIGNSKKLKGREFAKAGIIIGIIQIVFLILFIAFYLSLIIPLMMGGFNESSYPGNANEWNSSAINNEVIGYSLEGNTLESYSNRVIVL